MLYLLFALLAVIAFLIILNGFLRGSKKEHNDAILSVLLIILLIVSFWAYGWKMGIASVVFAFVAAIASRPLAAMAASRLFALGSETSHQPPGLPPKELEQISRELASFTEGILSGEERLAAIDQSANQRLAAIDRLAEFCEKNPEVHDAMKELWITRKQLFDLYNELLAIGAGQWICGHWIAASTLAYPGTLRFFHQGRVNKINGTEIVWSLCKHFEQGVPLKKSTEKSPETEKLPGAPVEFYTLPIGFGIAFGIFAKGFFLHWAIEAALLSVAWGLGACVLRLWVYRAYLANCSKMGERPRPIVFVGLQALTTGATIYATALIVMGIRQLF